MLVRTMLKPVYEDPVVAEVHAGAGDQGAGTFAVEAAGVLPEVGEPIEAVLRHGQAIS